MEKTKIKGKLAALHAELCAERDAILAKSAPLHKKRDALVAKIQPLEAELRGINAEIKAIEQPAILEVGKQIAAIVRASSPTTKSVKNG
jgi:hypothetical protein